jgi:hypothetical protein
VNNYEKDVYNGDPGYVSEVDARARRVIVEFPTASSGAVISHSLACRQQFAAHLTMLLDITTAPCLVHAKTRQSERVLS